MPVSVLIQDGSNVVYANSAAAALYRFGSKDAFIGTPIIDLIHPDERPRFEMRQAAVRMSEAPLPVIEQRRIRNDGTEMYVSTRGVPIEWRGERKIAGFQIEVTERVQAQQALAESEEHLRRLLDAIADGLLGLDASGNCTFCNPAGLEMLGIDDASGLIGRPLRGLVEGCDAKNRELMQGLLDGVLGQGRIVEHGHLEFRRSDGAVFPVGIRALPVLHSGMAVGAVVTFCDISQHRMERAQARDRDAMLHNLQTELARASQRSAMGELSSVIAHELGQPIAAIMATAGAARRQLAGEGANSIVVDEMLPMISSQAERANSIISGIRHLFERGDTERRAENINAVVGETCSIAGIELQLRDIVIEQVLEDDLPEVTINRVQIQQVVYNLMRNAADAMREGSDRRITVGTSRAGARDVRNWVRDSGSGLLPEIRANLFEPFSTIKSDGMGMGLYTCRTIVEAHGGSIGVGASGAAGTTMEFTVPAPP